MMNRTITAKRATWLRCLCLASFAVLATAGVCSAQDLRTGTLRFETQPPQAELNQTAADLAQPLPGTLVLWGGGEPSEEVKATFERFASPQRQRQGRRGQGRRGARRGQQGRNRNDQGDTQQQDEEGAPPESPPTAEWTPGEPLPENLAELRGVWVTATAEEYRTRVAGSSEEERLQDVLARGGVVAIPAMKSSCFQHVLVSPVFLESDASDEAVTQAVDQLSASPGVFGLGIPAGTAVFLNRRRVISIGDDDAVVVLPASQTREALFKPISGMRNWEDLVGLSRGSVARLGETFPPAEMAEPYVESGSLLIIGGGGMTEELWQTFIDSAGGPDAPFVVLPTASNPPGSGAGTKRQLERMGATDVTVLQQNTPEGVSSEEFVTALKRAKGVWFGGGRQWNFVDAYDGTGAVELFHDVLRRGGVIAGSSAGATIQGEYMVRGSPIVNTIMMAEGYERAFGFLPGATIDQHFAQRDRFDDLKSVHEAFPQLLCFGIDEATGIFVRRNIVQVMGRGGVAIFDQKTPPDEGKDYFSLVTGEYFDLKTREKITAEAAEAQLSAAASGQ